jgi:hypothetical protein
MTHASLLVNLGVGVLLSAAEDAVADAVDSLMAHYDEALEVPRYRVYLSKREKAAYISMITEPALIRAHGSLVGLMAEPPSPDAYPDVDVIRVVNQLWPGEDLHYGYALASYGAEETQIFRWHTSNPHGQWDWYEIGGRWAALLPVGSTGVDFARASSVDWHAMWLRGSLPPANLLDTTGWYDRPGPSGPSGSVPTWESQVRSWIEALAPNDCVVVVDYHC